jgi:putative adenylate-forming enzyme
MNHKEGLLMKRIIDIFKALKERDASLKKEWTREALDQFQQSRLRLLVRHAIDKSPFYRELYQGIKIDGGLVVTDLPPISKKVMMENYDKVVTDPRLKLKDLLAFIPRVKTGQRYLNEYRVFTTSGSTGLQGVFVFSRDEYVKAISTGMRVGYYCGFETPRYPKRWRFALIGAGSPLHVSAAYHHAVKSVLIKQINLPVTQSHNEIVAALNRFQPDLIGTYPSLASLLAMDQLEGRLTIQPIAVTTSGEMLTPEMEKNIERAWGIRPFNNYGATEAGLFISADCGRHCGLHILEDFFIIESVDKDNRPVPDGRPGAKILFTNLFNYTQPIIRYEIDDVITLADKPCRCGHVFKMISDIEGRADEILYITAKNGSDIPVHPHNLRSPLAEVTDIKQYQIVQEKDGLHITLALKNEASADEVCTRVRKRFNEKLSSLGVPCPELRFNMVTHIERDEQKMGKFRLIKSNVPMGSTR